jgi:hypothetical protein
VFEGASGEELKFLYLDTRELLGHYLDDAGPLEATRRPVSVDGRRRGG